MTDTGPLLQHVTSTHSRSAEATSRRAFLRRAAVTGATTAWATPAVVSFGSTAFAQASQGSPAPGDGGGGTTPTTGTVAGTVVGATTGAPVAGALVTVAGLSTTTDAGGAYYLPGVPTGSQTAQASATGYLAASQLVAVTEGATTIANFVLSPADQAIRAVLTWGADPDDLDLHISGPIDTDPTSRFHVWYSNLKHDDYVELDLDDTHEFGPETMTISITESGSGAFVPGEYRVWVHNYSNWTDPAAPTFAGSGARVVLFGLSGQLAEYDVSTATGDPSDDIWRVVRFTLDASGAISGVTPYADIVPGGNATVV